MPQAMAESWRVRLSPRPWPFFARTCCVMPQSPGQASEREGEHVAGTCALRHDDLDLLSTAHIEEEKVACGGRHAMGGV